MSFRDKDSYDCRICGRELESWNGSRIPMFELIEKPGEGAQMAKPKQKRPRDPNQLAKLVVDVATGDLDDEVEAKNEKAVARGKKGARARTAKLTPEQRQEIARAAAAARWKKSN